MKKSQQRTPEQIIEILRTVERETATGKSVAQSCKELGVSENTFYRWRKKYRGMSKPDAKKLRELEKENARLKKLLAEKELDNSILKEALEGNY